MKNTAVVGLGNMGIGMAKNLLAAGYSVSGYDLRPERRDRLAQLGGAPARGLADLAGAQAVFVMVMSGAQALDVVAQLKTILPDGATIIVSATIEPAQMRAVADILADSRLNLIDSPVSGGKFGAEAGTLTMMAAAPDEVFAANHVVLSAVGEQIFHVGAAPGMGQTVKAALQALIGVTFVGIFESLALGAKAGIKGQTLFDVFSSTHVGNTPFFKNCAELIMDRQFEDTGSHIGTMVKDLGISMALARENGVALFATSTAYELFQAGISLYPDGDNWSIVKLLEQISGEQVHW